MGHLTFQSTKETGKILNWYKDPISLLMKIKDINSGAFTTGDITVTEILDSVG